MCTGSTNWNLLKLIKVPVGGQRGVRSYKPLGHGCFDHFFQIRGKKDGDPMITRRVPRAAALNQWNRWKDKEISELDNAIMRVRSCIKNLTQREYWCLEEVKEVSSDPAAGGRAHMNSAIHRRCA